MQEDLLYDILFKKIFMRSSPSKIQGLNQFSMKDFERNFLLSLV